MTVVINIIPLRLTMPSYRRVIRPDLPKIDMPVVKIERSFCRIIACILGFLWCTLRILWYWIERIFLVVLILSLSIGLAWWLSLKPSLLRDWENADALLPEISWSGNLVTIANVRDHLWTSDSVFTPRYSTGIYNLDELDGVSYVITPFSSHDGPAHTMLTFSFSGGEHIAISPEIRKERGESFSAIQWLFNQYEFEYIIAHEDDVIKLRTNYRKNEVYMYPIKTEKDKIQTLFRSMLIRTDKLTKEPEFYNTLWNNCATNILIHANALRKEKLIAWFYTLLPSHSDEILYEAWLIDTKLPTLEAARAYYRIDELARTISGGVDFSTLIHKTIR